VGARDHTSGTPVTNFKRSTKVYFSDDLSMGSELRAALGIQDPPPITQVPGILNPLPGPFRPRLTLGERANASVCGASQFRPEP
jgi:hypothetical protein